MDAFVSFVAAYPLESIALWFALVCWIFGSDEASNGRREPW